MAVTVRLGAFVYRENDVAVRHWNDAALKRLGEALMARRVELDPRYHSRKLFAEEAGINLRRAADLENGRRGGAPPLAMQNVFAPAYRVEYQSMVDVLSGDGDLEALPGTPPHKSRARQAQAGRQRSLPSVAAANAEPGIGPYRDAVDAERADGGFVARNEGELAIWADPELSEEEKRSMVSWRRLVWDQAVRSSRQDAGLVRGNSAGL
jgi:hypothetical protein